MNVARLLLVRSAVMATALCLAGWCQIVKGDDKPKIPSISVTGTGRIRAQPDIAEIQVGVVSHAPNAKDALAANNEAMNRLQSVLKERGVAAKDIQITQIQIAPEYSQPRPIRPGAGDAAAETPAEFIPRIVGYKVENTVQITARRIDKLGPLLDATVQAGANQIYGISFRVEHADALLDEARKRAVASAKHKAELLAGEAGVVVGPPLTIEESEGPVPLPQFAAARANMMAAPAPSMPVAPGEQELSVTVQVVFALKSPK
jgi:uncharacterized protein YggE